MSGKRQPAILFILITVLIDSLSFGIVIPVFPKLIMSMENCDESQAALIGGSLMSAFAIMQFLMSPILGSLSDKFGRRPILLISLFGFGLDYLLLAFAPTIAWLYAGRIIAGIMGASYTTALAYIADISTPENRSKNYGMLGAAFGLGFILGPGLGGLMAQLDVRVPFIACALLSLINWLYGYFVLPESLAVENRRNFEIKRANPIGALMHLYKFKKIIGLLICFFLLYLGSQAVMSNWQYYSMLKFNWDEKKIGISITVVGLLVAFVQGFLVRKVNPRIGNQNAVLIGLALYTVGLVAFGLAPTGFYMMLAIIPYCLGGINGPAMQSIMTSSVEANAQGELQGAITSVQSLTMIIGPPLMSGIFNHYTKVSDIYFPGAAFVLAGVLVFVALIIAFVTLEHRFSREKK